jgi:hypothetical protein
MLMESRPKMSSATGPNRAPMGNGPATVANQEMAMPKAETGITQAEFDAAWRTIVAGEAMLREIRLQQGKLASEAQRLNSEVYRARELVKRVADESNARTED